MGFALYHIALIGLMAVSLVIQRSNRPYHGLWGFAVSAFGLGPVLASLHSEWPFDWFFAMLRMWAWAIFLYGPLLLIAYAGLQRRRRPVLAGACAFLATGIGAVAIDAFFIEPQALEITRHTLTSSKVDRKLTIAVLSDIQTDEITDYERDVIRRTMDAQPDLIVMPGDFIQASGPSYPTEGARFKALIRALSAPLGVYAVGGNVEQGRDWVSVLFEGTQIEAALERRVHSKDGVTITALSFDDSFNPRLELPPQPGFHIAFGHGPDFALGRVHADLLIAGHTHGGQVKLPFIGPILTLSEVPRDWAEGLTPLEVDRSLVVSRGIGLERGFAPRLRFLCRPELVFIEVSPAVTGRPGDGTPETTTK